ncbi:MAG: oligosaccharide flippase family protein [Acidobacteria bacterium]|nr:oligosaccharide flippase family protein [Acidobacteriota bacterium]
MNSEADTLSANSLPAAPTAAPRFGETIRQTGVLFSAQTGAMVVNLLVSLVLLRWMEPTEMGRLAFCLSVILISNLFFEVGIFAAGSRVLALAHNAEDQRRALGALVYFAAAIGALLAMFIAATSPLIDLVFHTDLRWLLMTAAALAFFLPFQLLIELSCQGLNRIRQLAIFQLSLSGLYLSALLVLAVRHRLTAKSALVAYLTATGIAALLTLVQLRPAFQGASQFIRPTLKEARHYGLNLYLARITATASVRLDNFVIKYFVADIALLGLYDRAQKLANPISTLARALAITRFRAFANVKRVPERITKWNTIILLASSLAMAAFGPYLLAHVFPKYADSAPLLVPFAAFNLFAGLFQPYNTFLAARGHSAAIRNIALVVTFVSIVGLFVTVPRYGTLGAAWAGAFTMLLDYLLHLYYYRKSLKAEAPIATQTEK